MKVKIEVLLQKRDDIASIALCEGYDLDFFGDSGNRTYIAKNKNSIRMKSDTIGIYHDILVGGYLSIFEIIEKVKEKTNDFFVCGIKTDSVMIKSNIKLEFEVDDTNLESILKQKIKNEEFKEITCHFKGNGRMKPIMNYFIEEKKDFELIDK